MVNKTYTIKQTSIIAMGVRLVRRMIDYWSVHRGDRLDSLLIANNAGMMRCCYC